MVDPASWLEARVFKASHQQVGNALEFRIHPFFTGLPIQALEFTALRFVQQLHVSQPLD
jgi:hypothetical protein